MPPTTQQLEAALAQTRLQLIRTRQRLYGMEAEALVRQNRELLGYPGYRTPPRFTSQFGEDMVLWDIFGGELRGFYIEAGAFDGVSYSVTYPFEAAGWRGLLVEAIPERAAECQKNRPGSRVVHAALGPRGSSGTADFTITRDVYGGMCSYLRPTPDNAGSKNGHTIAQRRTVQVPLTTLDEALKVIDHEGPIDAVVLDVEGNEQFVLQGFDLHRHRPRVLMLEDNSRGNGSPVAQVMATMPYVLAGWVEANRVYIRADEAELIERARDALFTRP